MKKTIPQGAVMREYAKVSPQVWTGETARFVRGDRDLQIVVQYLIHGPMANMYGLYHLPLPVLCHHLGNLSYERALGIMQILDGLEFSLYDEASEQVFVINCAHWQIGPSLEPMDKRVAGVKNHLKRMHHSPFHNAFLDRYRDAYHLHDVSPFEAPSKSLRSQKNKKKEKEKEKKEGPSKPLARGFLDLGIVNGWPQSWEPVQRVIEGNTCLQRHQDWIADLAYWESQDAYLESPVNLAKLLEGAAAHLVKEEYHPKSKKAFRQKIGNLLRTEAKIQRDLELKRESTRGR